MRTIRTLCAAAIAAVLVLLTPTASQAVAVNGPYTYWAWPGSNFYNLDIRLTVLGHDAGIRRFWAHQFHFGFGENGYLGLQIGSSPNLTKIALFSIFGANGHADGNCTQGTELGVPFHTCRVDPYNWAVGRAYRLRVWSLSVDSAGEWFGAWVQDTVTGSDRYIGRIRVPLSWAGFDSSVSWTERFGTAPATCSGMGWSKVQWDFPTANAGSVHIVGDSSAIGAGDCPSYTRILKVPGARVQEMGRTLPAAPNLNFTSYPTISQGSAGDRVRAAQYLLLKNGHDAGTVDGIFGPRTALATKSFQASVSLSADGVIGRRTWTALLSAGSRPTLARGSTGADVSRLQRALTAALSRTVTIDGIFGSGTETAVRDYQSSRGLTVDGIVGSQTWGALQAGR